MRRLKVTYPPTIDDVHEAWRQGLSLDGESDAAAFAFDAIDAYHLDKPANAALYASKASELNPDAWLPLHVLLTPP